MGLELARRCLKEGWTVGAAGRRADALEALRQEAPDRVFTQQIDITLDTAPEQLHELIEKMGGMDIYFHSSGVGNHNTALIPEIELNTMKTNAEGFVRMVTTAFDYFRGHGGGQIAIISSIAGTKGLGAAPAYSATKRMQNTYIDALAQLSHMEHAHIRFTDIRPGFVRTALLNDGRKYPLLMEPKVVAERIFEAIRKQKRRVVIDRRYAVLVFFWRLLPEGLWERMTIKKEIKKA